MFKEKRNTSKLIIHLQAEANHFDYEESRLDYFDIIVGISHNDKLYHFREFFRNNCLWKY